MRSDRASTGSSRTFLRGVAAVVAGAAVVGWAPATASDVASRTLALSASHHETQADSGRLAHFSGQGISFSYPAGWRVRTRGLIINASMFSEIVELSPQPMHRPCNVRHHPDGEISVSCRAPFAHLRHDSLLATWSHAGSPGWTLKSATGKRIEVGGITGKWDVRSAAGSYPALKATTAISVVAPVPGEGPANFLSLNVQIRGPHTASMIRQVRSMVRSMHWNTSS